MTSSVCARSIVYRAMVDHGPPFVPGNSFTTQELADSLGVLPQHARLLRRLLAMLEEDGYVHGRAGTGQWTVACCRRQLRANPTRL